MMETTHLWNGTYFAHRRRLYAARLARVLLKRQMSPARMMVLPPLSVGEMTLRLYTALNYSQNSAHDLRRALNGA